MTEEQEQAGDEEEESILAPPPEPEEEEPPPPCLESQFEAFSQFMDSFSDGKTMTLKKNDFWMTQAELLDMKTITTTDTGICWIQYKKRCLTLEEYNIFLQDLAERKGMELDMILQHLIDCGEPGVKQKKKKKPEQGPKVDAKLF